MKWYWWLIIVVVVLFIIYFIARSTRMSKCSGIFQYTEPNCKNPIKEIKNNTVLIDCGVNPSLAKPPDGKSWKCDSVNGWQLVDI